MNSQDYIFKVLTAAGSGSGFITKRSSLIITNYHVVEGFKEVAIEDCNKNRYLATVVMVNDHRDLALLTCNDLTDKKSTISINPNLVIKNTQKVHIKGYPFGMPFTINEGIISSTKQIIDNKEFIQTDAAINPGNSGGPIVDEKNNLVAVATSKFSDADNIGFGIPYHDVTKELEEYNFNDTKFRVKCHNCSNYTENKSNYCEKCGSDIKKSFFEAYKNSHIGNIIEDSLKSINIDPVLCREGIDYWTFYRGSSLIRIFSSGKDYFYLTSPLNLLPKENLEPLLLYLASNKESPFSFGIKDNIIYLSYRIHKNDFHVDIYNSLIKNNITKFIKRAGVLDSILKEKYLCEKSLSSKE